MVYLAYKTAQDAQELVDISADVKVIRWGTDVTLKSLTQEGQNALMNFYDSEDVYLTYGPNGNSEGSPKHEGLYRCASPNMGAIGSTFICRRSGEEHTSQF